MCTTIVHFKQRVYTDVQSVPPLYISDFVVCMRVRTVPAGSQPESPVCTEAAALLVACARPWCKLDFHPRQVRLELSKF